jgi:hypothetical protein
VVLGRPLAIAIALTGCGQSLFDNNVGNGSNGMGTDGGNGSGSDGNMVVPSTCPAGCIGDAAADIDGSRPGWRYLEDGRDRTWAVMTAAADGFAGANAPNAIGTCAGNPSAPACTELPGALLFTSGGATGPSDPAVEFTVDSQKVVQLTVRAFVPSGQPEQRIRLYRNSREDVLFTAPAMPGTLFERAITIDALAGERVLVALAPTGMGASQVGVHFYINETGEVFPKDCKVAVSFSSATGNTVADACGAAPFTYRDYDLSGPDDIPPVLVNGPFGSHGMAADISLTEYFNTTATLSRLGDSTTQMWVRHDAFDPGYSAFPFSDVDIDRPGGIQVYIYEPAAGGKSFGAGTFTAPFPNQVSAFEEVTYPDDTNWHFLRIVHTGGEVSLCVDGTKLGSFQVAAGGLATNVKPHLGINPGLSPSGAFFDGRLDDVRAFSVALPCE